MSFNKQYTVDQSLKGMTGDGTGEMPVIFDMCVYHVNIQYVSNYYIKHLKCVVLLQISRNTKS